MTLDFNEGFDLSKGVSSGGGGTAENVGNGTITINQGGTQKGTFTVNQSGNTTINLDAGGGSALSETGSTTQPIYINSEGAPTATSYSLAKSVPSDAVFTDTTYSAFTGADGTSAGAAGLVPAPTATDNTKFLKGDGTWEEVALSSKANTSLNNITDTGKVNIANISLPSNSVYKSITTGASGTNYTAPANGWYLLAAQSSGTNSYLVSNTEATGVTNTLYLVACGAPQGFQTTLLVPAIKGVIYNFGYGDVTNFRIKFIYANGSVSEYTS